MTFGKRTHPELSESDSKLRSDFRHKPKSEALTGKSDVNKGVS